MLYPLRSDCTLNMTWMKNSINLLFIQNTFKLIISAWHFFEIFASSRLSLRGGGQGFPLVIMGMTPGHFQLPKEIPRCSISCQLIVYTRELEIVVKALPLQSSFGAQMNAFYCRNSLKASQYSLSSFTFKSVIWRFGFH